MLSRSQYAVTSVTSRLWETCAVLSSPEARSPKAEARRPVIFFAVHGIASLFSQRMGIHSAGGGDRALYSPASGYLLDFYHSVPGMGRGADLHCRRSASRCRAAARVVSGVSAAAADS